MKIMQTIVKTGSAQVATYGTRWSTNHVAHLECGHVLSFGKRKPKIGTKTRCLWCEQIPLTLKCAENEKYLCN